jgi:hypothetical protein
LNPDDHRDTIKEILALIDEHKATVTYGNPLTIARDEKYYPCANKNANCRTGFSEDLDAVQ